MNGPQLDAALRTAAFQAQRLVRTLSMPEADRDDLRQTIVLVVMGKARRFDDTKSSWPTFIALIARHAAADLARRTHRAPVLEPLDGAEYAIADPSAPDQDLRVDIRDAMARLPPALAHLIDLLAETGSVAAAQRKSALSPATFYRRMHDLRMQFLAAGLAPDEKNELSPR
ncbi:sigma factor [Pararhizobium haloflavum]|uniref:sigma factor n=1 Tax=Pararhizobium haloflavum TaxID=2037914 RepID=UPI00130011E6|nr:sigma factor [Pararhizobium haloflavum]